MGQKSSTYRYRWFFGVIPVLLLVVALACDDSDNPVGPGEPENYPMFFYDDVSKRTYEYGIHCSSIDSFSIGFETRWDIDASPDGSRLYMATLGSGVAVFDRQSRQVVTTLPYKASGGLAVSADGSMLGVFADETRILSTDDFSVLYQDSTPVKYGEFGGDNHTIYAITKSTQDSVFILNMDEAIPTAHFLSFPNRWISLVKPTPDEQHLVLLVRYSQYTSSLELYSMALDSVVFRDTFDRVWGDIQVSLDGRYVFVAPGYPLAANAFQEGIDYHERATVQDERSHFMIYDIAQGMSLDTVSTIGIKDGTEPSFLPVDKLLLTPDREYLVGLFLQTVFLYDIEAKRFTKYDDGTLSNYYPALYDMQSQP